MNVAFIPVRGGSKSIPMKNIKLFAGKPLVYWTVRAAVECPEISRVFVATDSDQIKHTVQGFNFNKVTVVGRGEQTASDTAATEDAMLEFANGYEFDNIILIQATSPLLTSQDLTRGIEILREADSVLSVVRQKRFIWEQSQYASPLNYDYKNRPRRQEFEGFLVENGAFYITSREALLRTGCRLSGKIKVVEMSGDSYTEIDEPEDWIIAEGLLKKRINAGKCKKQVKLFLMDCDGTLTDGGMFYTSDGDVMKEFNTRDGRGISLLKGNGVLTGIITGENSEIVRRRGEKLGVDEIWLGVQDKVGVVREICEKYDIDVSEVAYIGDDLNDIEVMNAVGIAICPADAVPQVKEIAVYVTAQPGGHGAVREAVDYILDYK